MALRKRPIASGIATLLFSGYVSALGLGEIKLNSALNEPLDAEIPLFNLGDLAESDIIAGLASNADFANAGVDKELILTTLVFSLDMDAPGGPTLRILSKKPIREPYLDFLVDVQWPAGRVLREYTLLLDLPVYAGASASKKKIDQPAVSRPAAAAQGSLASAQVAPAAPSRPAPSRAPVPPGNEQYVVQRGDTLWSIARRMQGDMPMERRMDDLLQINPEAFINGDINLLRSGAVLRLPDYGVLETRSADRGGYISTAADRAPQLSASGRLESAVLPESTGGRLTLEAGDEGGAESSMGAGQGVVSGVRGEIAELQEELDKSNRENSELKQRLASLEDQLSTMQKLVEIGDDDLRAVQVVSQQQSQVHEGADTESAPELIGADSATASGEGEAVSDDEVDSPALALFPSANVAERKSVQQTPAGPSAAVGDESSAAANASDVASVTGSPTAGGAEAARQTPPEEPRVAPPAMEMKTEKGWIDKVNGYLVVLLGLVVVAIGAVVAVVLRRGKKPVQQEYQPPVEKFSPPPAKVRERPRSEPVVNPASSIDDIDLKLEDDLFAQTVSQPVPVASKPAPAKVAPVAAVAVAATAPVAAAPAVPAPASPSAPSAPGAPQADAFDDMELDLSEFDLDEGHDVEFGEAPAAPAPRADLNLDEEFDFLGDIDEGDTQLELAQAYIEMGDQAGAREILLEVAEGGSDEQKQRARQMLDQLG